MVSWTRVDLALSIEVQQTLLLTSVMVGEKGEEGWIRSWALPRYVGRLLLESLEPE
jgi:hypothetical protein